jgi:hypothetical protein
VLFALSRVFWRWSFGADLLADLLGRVRFRYDGKRYLPNRSLYPFIGFLLIYLILALISTWALL